MGHYLFVLCTNFQYQDREVKEKERVTVCNTINFTIIALLTF